MAKQSQSTYDNLADHIRQVNLYRATASLLHWDEQTVMPCGGGAVAFRARQIAQLASLIHQKSMDSQMGDWLAACEMDRDLSADPLCESAVNLREIRRSYEKALKLPTSLVEELASTASLSRHAWLQASRTNDFASYRPWLEKMINLNRCKANCLGWPDNGEPWDALADGYEPNMTAQWIENIFNPLRHQLQAMVHQLPRRKGSEDNRVGQINLPIGQQRGWVRHIADCIGFDFSRGRLDTSAHPFCSGTHRDDVRMTTRFRDNGYLEACASTMHEAGHGIYNQGLPGGDHIGMPMGEPISLAIHESQSRLWENQVGRSRAFCQWCHGTLTEFFGSAVNGVEPEDIYTAVNAVRPGLIRVEADEVTYNLHIMIRFEIERTLISGDLAAADLPSEWNRKYKEYLGVQVSDDTFGCMQDIHWSQGAFGYFPTYTLGNIYAAQFFDKALQDIPDLYDQFKIGQFSPLKSWLNEKIHAQGKRYRSATLCEHVTGQPLSCDFLLNHLNSKLRS